MNDILGIHQSDVIIRSALIAGMNELRANPWMLDYVFASLPRDTLTAGDYGAQEVQRAKEWFQNTNIPVLFNINLNDVKFPCITINLQSSQEQEQEGSTLADTHYDPRQDDDGSWPSFVGPLTAVAYNRTTGQLTFNSTEIGTFILAPGMIVFTKTGDQFPILDVVNSYTVKVAAGITAELSGCQIKPQRPSSVLHVESSVFRESYAIGCHVDSEPVHLTYLHSIMSYVLLCYRQSLLEARGFERSVISSADFRRDEETMPEFVYSRYISVTGYVRQVWLKAVAGKLAQAILSTGSTNPTVDDNKDTLDLLFSGS